MSNPLLKNYPLPPFSEIKPEYIKPAIETLVQECKDKITYLIENPEKTTWNTLQYPLDTLSEKLSQAWSPISLMNSVVNSKEIRKAHDECLEILADFNTWLGQNEKLYKSFLYLSESSEYKTLNDEQKKVITDNLRDFRLAGVSLEKNKKDRFAKIQQKLSSLSSKYFGNVLDATMRWTKEVTDKKELTGIPENILDLLKQQATSKNKKGYLLTLDYPNYHSVLTFCDNRELRKEMYEAYVTRASDVGPFGGSYDNSKIMNEIVKLRYEMAQLLEFSNYTDYSLSTKMANSSTEILEFLNQLVSKSYNKAKEELADLALFAKPFLKENSIQAWDIAYFSEKFKESLYSINQEEIRQWFPIKKVLTGMFSIVQSLFGISIVEDKTGADKWHTDVRLFNVNKNDKLIGQFFIDLYSRENKRDGAWMDTCRNRWQKNNSLQHPVAYLICNFMPAIKGQPSLLTHDEVITLFHEFGHTIHHVLTEIDYPEISGINGVPWDAVELPSQLLENWCWQKDSIKIISEHFKTKEPFPDEKLNQLLKAKNFQSSMMLLRQLEFSIFDIKLHTSNVEELQIQQILNDVRRDVAVIKAPEFNRFQNAFSHIFDGGYSAGYYSYLWAEVLSADVFSSFEEQGILNTSTGEHFLKTILSRGGSADPMSMFVKFQGRKPSIEALLRHKGINK